MTPLKWSTAVVLALDLMLTAPLFAQGRAGRNPQGQACAQIRQACEAAGFTAGAGRGNGLRRDCVEPILAGERQSPHGRLLPSVDPAVVRACNGKSTPATPDISLNGPPNHLPGYGLTGFKNSDGLMMSEPVALFPGPKLGLHDMPDQQTPILRDSGGGYQLYVTAVKPKQPGGVVAVFRTSDLTQPAAYHNDGLILSPPKKKIKGGGPPCTDPKGGDGCAIYFGMESVFETGTPHHLVGFYIADQIQFRDGSCGKGAFYGQLGVASTQDGKRWTMHGPTLRGGPVPTTCPKPNGGGPIAFNQPTVLQANGHYYVYFAVSGKEGFGVARAPVQTDGLPGAWEVLVKAQNSPQWKPVPLDQNNVASIQDFEAVVMMKGEYMTMPWISYNAYLQTYLLTFITKKAFYYSKLENKDLDAQTWTAPQLFQPVPGEQNWGQCQKTWENASFVTPGAADNRTTGKDGYVILSVVPGWKCKQRGARSFSIASYAFGVTTPPAPPITSPWPTPRPAPCRNGRPGCQK